MIFKRANFKEVDPPVNKNQLENKARKDLLKYKIKKNHK